MVKKCDLVLEGGGVKGIALVGAIEILEKAGYTFNRVAGTSAGAVVGSLVAAGMPSSDLVALMRAVDYRRFQDESWGDTLPFGKTISLLLEQGIYEGKYLHNWLADALASCGVRTFGDLSYSDDALDLPPEQRFRLVVMASDLCEGRLCRLPWDYPGLYQRDAGGQTVADAVRASMSIPFFYEPVRLDRPAHHDKAVLVDGGVLSNFPIDVFDRHNGEPRWPTFGLKLSARQPSDLPRFKVDDTVGMVRALIGTMVSAHDQMHVDDEEVVARTIFIDTAGVNSTNFDLDKATAERLYQSGRAAAQKFLEAWDWEAYKAKYRTVGAGTSRRH